MSFSKAAVQVRRFLNLPLSKTYLRKHHSFVLCKYDLGIKLSELIKDKDLIRQYIPDRQKPGSTFELTRTTEVVQDIAIAAASLIKLIHDLGFSLDGLLTLKMLYWIPETKTLKVGGLKRGDIKSKTDEMAERDYGSINRIFVEEIFSSVIVPRELDDWLYYLKTDPLFYEELIPRHMYLLDDEAKVGRFTVLYSQLLQVRSLSVQMYVKAVSFVYAGNCDGDRRWPAEVIQSELLEDIKNYQDASGNITLYTCDEGGLVKFGRHSCAHLLGNSVETRQDENGQDYYSLKIRASEIFSLIDCFAEGLFEQLQKGMFIISRDMAKANLPKL